MKKVFTFRKILRLFLSFCFVMILFKTQAQTKHVVAVTNNVFTPNVLTINVGDTVEWRNTEGRHNVNGTTAIFPNNPESFGNNTDRDWVFSHVFNMEGKYDYQCDPHVGLGMTGKIEVKPANDQKHLLTINFSDMDPHNNQNLYIWVTDKDSGTEVERKTEDIGATFSVQISGIEKDHSYFINFFADHNKNGFYDAPPTDHAWRLELNNVTGDTTLNFTHNTNFTDIGTTTGINEILESRITSIYPNPASSKVTIEFSRYDEDASISIFDVSGKIFQLYKEIKSSSIELDISTLLNGIYLLEISGDNYRETAKLIKR